MLLFETGLGNDDESLVVGTEALDFHRVIQIGCSVSQEAAGLQPRPGVHALIGVAQRMRRTTPFRIVVLVLLVREPFADAHAAAAEFIGEAHRVLQAR